MCLELDSLIERLERNDPTLTKILLNVWTKTFNAVDLQRFCFALRDNTAVVSFMLSGRVQGNHDDLCRWIAKAIECNRGITSLHLSNFTVDVSAIVKAVEKNKFIEKFSLVNVSESIPSEVLCSLAKNNRNLVSLKLSRCRLAHASVSGLRDGLMFNSSLQKLSLDNNYLGSPLAMDVLCDILSKNRILQSLCLSGNGLSRASLESLCCRGLNCNSWLRHLDLSSNTFDTDGGALCLIASSVEHHPAMTSLSLQRTQMTREGLKKICSSLRHHPTMTELVVSNNPSLGNDDDNDVATHQHVLVQLLKEQKKICRLSVSGCGLSGARVIQMCGAGLHLKHLDVSDNDLRGDGDDVVMAIAQWIRQNTSLQRFNVHGIDDRAEKHTELLNALQENGFFVSGTISHDTKDAVFTLVKRNKAMHKKCKAACQAMLALQRKNRTILGRDCIRLLAMHLHQTRGDILAWDDQKA